MKQFNLLELLICMYWSLQASTETKYLTCFWNSKFTVCNETTLGCVFAFASECELLLFFQYTAHNLHPFQLLQFPNVIHVAPNMNKGPFLKSTFLYFQASLYLTILSRLHDAFSRHNIYLLFICLYHN